MIFSQSHSFNSIQLNSILDQFCAKSCLAQILFRSVQVCVEMCEKRSAKSEIRSADEKCTSDQEKSFMECHKNWYSNYNNSNSTHAKFDQATSRKKLKN